MDVSSASALAPIPFTSSPDPTLGVEIELQIVDPSTFNLKQGSVDLLDRLGDHPRREGGGTFERTVPGAF